MPNTKNALLYTVWLVTWPFSMLSYWIILTIVAIIALILPLPYTLAHRSANFGMLKRDMPPVQLYLDQFEKLHPELMSSIREAYETASEDENKRRKKTERSRILA
jgi:hypothetical protein